MTHEQIAASWATRGDLARASSFTIHPDLGQRLQFFLADLANLGKGGLITARVFKTVPMDASEVEIENALEDLYVDLEQAVISAPSIGLRKP